MKEGDAASSVDELLRKSKHCSTLPERSWESKGMDPGMGVGGQGDFLQSLGTCIGLTAKAGKATKDRVVKGLE